MNWLSDDHVGKLHSPFGCTTDHRFVSKSKIFMPCEGPYSPAMKRPLGDHRGDHTPSDPGSVVIWCLAGSRTLKTELEKSTVCSVEKRILCPSGDQFGSFCPSLSSGRRGQGVPPCAEATYAFMCPFESWSKNSI